MSRNTLLWRRLDAPGHDSCRLQEKNDGWQLEGFAAFRHEKMTAGLHYQVVCDRRWRSRRGLVRGWIGTRNVDYRITRTARGVWSLNGLPLDQLNGLLDLDLGFTPATNLTQLRRNDLPIGQGADVAVAWLDISAGTLQPLDQRYERRSPQEYWYEAPRFGYAALLQVDEAGFVIRYPGLWQAVL